MEHVLFKISFPAEFHAQTAVEAAIQLHSQLSHRWGEIARVELETQESAVRIIDKTGPLHNPADRDHCLQYMVAVGLLFGELTADHYLDQIAHDPRIDALRSRMVVKENPRYTRDYLDPEKRSIANSVQIFFNDGSSSPKVEVEYPVGHRFRRAEGIPLLVKKFRDNASTTFSSTHVERLEVLLKNGPALESMPVHQFINLWIPEQEPT